MAQAHGEIDGAQRAAEVSTNVAAPPPRSYTDLASSRSGYDCAPAPIGAGTSPTIRSNDAGTVAWWYCATTDGKWRVNWAAATRAQLSVRNIVAEMRSVLQADDKRAAFDAAVARNVRVPLDSPALLAVWRPYAKEMNDGQPVALPVASISSQRAMGTTLSSLLAVPL